MTPVQLLVVALGVVLYSALCFAAGWVVCMKVQHRKLAREVVVEVRWFKRWGLRAKAWFDQWGMLLVGVLVMLATVLTVLSAHESGKATGVSSSALREVRDQSDCLTTYANQLYDSLTPRQKASEALQDADKRFKKADQLFAEALDRLLSDALGGTASEEKRTQDAVELQRATEAKARALADANAVSDRLSRKRAQNPYPAPPKEACPK